MIVTATRAEVSAIIACNPRVELVGRLDMQELRHLWARSCAVYFPTNVESFGYPLAEARVNGQPVIALETPQNREIAGPALCGFNSGDQDSLLEATQRAFSMNLEPDPLPFQPDSYFRWLFGAAT
ncbi:MAG: glycosyltransferase [Mycobacterium sp.]